MFCATPPGQGSVSTRQVLGLCESHSGALKRCPGWPNPLLWPAAIGWEPGTGAGLVSTGRIRVWKSGDCGYPTASVQDFPPGCLQPFLTSITTEVSSSGHFT